MTKLFDLNKFLNKQEFLRIFSNSDMCFKSQVKNGIFYLFFLCLKKFHQTIPFKYFNHFYFSSVSKYEHTEVFPQW